MKLISQYPNEKKSKKIKRISKTEKRLTKAERIDYASKCIIKNVDTFGAIPMTNNYIQAFCDKKYKEETLRKLRHKINKKIKEEAEWIITISTLDVRDIKKKDETTYPRVAKWFYCLATIDFILTWVALARPDLLRKQAKFATIVATFRNKLLIFTKSEKEEMTSKHRFIKFFKSRMNKIYSFIQSFKKDDDNYYDDYYDAMRLKEEYLKKLEEAEVIKKEYAEKLYNAIQSNYKKLNDQYSVDNFEKNVNSDFTSENRGLNGNSITKNTLLVSRHDVSFYKENKDVKNNLKYTNQSKYERKTRSKFEKEISKLCYELKLREILSKKLGRIARYMNAQGIIEYEKYKKYTISIDGIHKEIWATRLYQGHDLTTSFAYKKRIFRSFAVLLKHYRDVFFDFMKDIGIVALYRYKKIKFFTKKQWYGLIMKGYSRLIYGD